MEPGDIQRYSGAAFLPDGTRRSGTIAFSDGEIRLHSSDGIVSLPLQGASMRLGGAGDRLLFFEHPSSAGTSIYTSDRSVLRDPALASSNTLAPHLLAVRRHGRNRWLTLAGVVVFVVALVYALAAARGPLVALVARQIPPELEVRLGEAAMKQILAGKKIVDDPVVTTPMQQILDEVLAGAAGTPYQFRLHVVEDGSVNAFAVPGGYLALHTGLIEKATSADEIAGVLGHEIAHVTERHSLRQMLSAMGVYVLVQAVTGDASGLVAVVADRGSDLLVLSFSRDAEREADSRGVEILRQAGIDPAGMVSFFALLKQENATGGLVPAFLSTHPATEERIDRLERLASEAGRGLRKVAVEIAPAQAAIRATKSSGKSP